MRFYYQSADMGSGQKVATKCIRVSSTAVTREIIETLIEKFRPDMKMLEVPEYALYEIHESGERKLNPEEKPLLGTIHILRHPFFGKWGTVWPRPKICIKYRKHGSSSFSHTFNCVCLQ